MPSYGLLETKLSCHETINFSANMIKKHRFLQDHVLSASSKVSRSNEEEWLQRQLNLTLVSLQVVIAIIIAIIAIAKKNSTGPGFTTTGFIRMIQKKD